MQVWVKMVGIVVIVFVGVQIGYCKGNQLSVCKLLLEEMIHLLKNVQVSLKYRCASTLEALQSAQAIGGINHLPIDFMQMTIQALPVQLAERLKQAQKEIAPLIGSGNFDVFQQALLHLGEQNITEETEKLQYAIVLLEQAQAQASARAQRDTKLYRLMGLTGGAAVALILL